MPETSSYRHVLRATALLGSSSLAQILIGIVKVKALAVFAGPAGVGLVGIYSAVLNLATSVAGLGIGQGAVRELAAAEDKAQRDLVRRALVWGSCLLGVVALAVMVLGRSAISSLAFGSPAHGGDIAWIGLGTLLAVVAGAQSAILNGLHRVRDLALLGALTSLFAAAAGIAATMALGADGALLFVLSVPVVSLIVGSVLIRKVEPLGPGPERLSLLVGPFAGIIQLGFAMSLAAIVGNLAQVAVRASVTDRLGIEAAGHLQASWTISMQYIGFIASAMALDFFPRLSAAADDDKRVRRLVNEQTEMTLLLAGPILILTYAMAPLVIRLLYSADFDEAADILRWQIVGDVFKLAAWPLGFLFLARRKMVAFVATDVSWAVIYVVLVETLLPRQGVVATGTAFALAYLAYLAIMLVLSRRLGIAWSRVCTLVFALTALSILILVVIEALTPDTTPVAGLLFFVIAALASVLSIRKLKNGSSADPTDRLP